MKFLLFLICLVTWSCSVSKPDFSAKKSLAKSATEKIIETFYQVYFGSPTRTEHLTFSKSFNQLVEKNKEVCEKHAGTDICGWGADGDLYLNTQETDPNLSFENSGFTMREPKPGVVEVRFNVYPSITDNEGFYDRIIQFVMILENAKWVVDDMIADGESGRKLMEDEILVYTPKAF